MAKNKKQPKSLTDAQAFDSYLADQDKKKQEQANGQVRYREAASASRVQYTNPTYKGNSENGNYKWETQALKDYKMPKGMGKSYNDKFNYMTQQMGMTPGQAEDFRKYMDYNEDKSKDKYAVKRYNFKKDEKGNLIEVNSGTPDEAWKLDRSSYTDGSGLNTKNDIIDGILSGMSSKAVQSFQNAQDRRVKEAENQQKGAEKKSQQQAIAETNKVAKGFRTSTSANFPNNNVSSESKNGSTWDGIKKGALKALEIVDRPGDAVRTGIKEKMDGNSFWQGAKDGFMGDKNTSGTELNKTLGFDPTKDKVDRTIANVLGMAGTGALGTLVQSFNKDIANKMGDLASGMATEVALDPLNLVGAGTVKSVKSLPHLSDGLLNGLGKMAKVDGEIPTYTGKVSEAVLNNLAPNHATGPKTSNDLYDFLATGEIPASKEPAGPMKINDWQDKAFPKLNDNPQINDEIVQQAMKQKELTNKPEEIKALDDLIESITGTRPRNLKAEEDAFVAEQMKPHYEAQQKVSDAQTQWETTVKNAKEQIAQIKGNFGKIYVPKHSLEDYPVPKQFLASSKDKVSDDIFSITDRMGFNSPEELVQFLKVLDLDSKTKLKDLLPKDVSGDTRDLTYLEQTYRKQFKDGNVNNSQNVDQAIESVTPSKKITSMDEFNALVRGETPKKAETEAVNPAPVSGQEAGKPFSPLVRPNLQRFNTGSNPKLFTDGVVKSEKAIDTTLGKYYENYVNSNHSFKVAHEKTLKNAIEKAKADGKPQKAAQLEKQLQEVKKSGSDVEKAVSNEEAAGVAAKETLKRHFKELDGIVKDDAEMADALTYMFAKDLAWRKENGLSEYQLPDGVDWGQINDIINRGDLKDHFKNDFVGAIRNLTQEWRDVMLDYGVISKEAHKALGENPYYMPLQRDISGKLDNIDRGLGLRGSNNHRSSGPTIVHSMGKGDLESFYKNPIETLINNTFAVYKNAYKEDSARQMAKLADLDKGNPDAFFKEITEKQYQEGGGIKFANDGNPRYLRIQPDLMKVLKENDEVIQTDVLGKLTNMFAGLKTRSLEYQMTAAYRDLATNYLTSQITNPFRYIGEAFRSIKNGNKDVKAIGGYFDKAYNEHTAGVDPEKIMNEFKRSYGGTVESFNVKDPKSWKKAAQTIGKYLDMPFKPIKKLGEITDEIPRDIEARETERLFMKKNGDKIQRLKTALEDVNNRLAQTEGVTDPFDPILQGVDKLQSQKAGIERMLSKFDSDLKREQLYRSRDVINYQRHGRGGVAKKIRQWVVFANTTTQSKDKVIRSFIERPGATLFKAALLMSPFITAQKIMHENMSDSDKQIYDNLPNYVKQMNYVYINNGKLFTVPKVQELALISDPIEAMLQGEPLDASARMAIKESIPYQLGNFAQGLVPADGTTPIQNMQVPGFVGLPAIDTIANSKTGFNQKPVSYGAKFSPKDAKANDWTLDVYKKLMGDKPGADRLQYLTEQYLGDYGKYAGNTANFLTGDKSTDALNTLIQAINPIQDRYYNNNGRFVKPIPQETRK